MNFTQILDVRSTREGELHELARTWHSEQRGVAPGYEGIRVLADRDDPTRFFIVVDFASEEQANQNDDRPETRAWAEKLRTLVTAEPVYHSCQQVCSSYQTTANT
jgi:heme-degrading monooxygenase HmoA